MNAPRVTLDDIEDEIESVFFFTGEEGARAGVDSGAIAMSDAERLCLLTFCVLVLRNGFTVTGESACASPENFDAKIGRKVARQKAVEKVWPLLGFRLLDRLGGE